MRFIIPISSLFVWFLFHQIVPKTVYRICISSLQRSTALFGKVYLTIFQGKRRRLVFKTGVIIAFKMILIKLLENILKYIFTYVYIFVIKLKHNMIFICVSSIDI